MTHRGTARTWGQRLDHLRRSHALALGAGLGLVGGAALWFADGLLWQGGIALTTWGVAVGLALSSRAVAIVEPSQTGKGAEATEEPVGSGVVEVTDEPFGLRMVEVPATTFMMGSDDNDEFARDDEKPAREVRLSPYALAVFPVTRGLYAEVLDLPRLKHPNKPESDVSWLDAIRFCNALSLCANLTPCYRIDGDDEDALGVTWLDDADGYRLPTEAEWEAACRAGTRTPWSCERDALGEHAWFDENSRKTMPVGQKDANRWALHDMHGNVLEWCWDGYGRYDIAETNDPRGPDEHRGSGRVVRGGSVGYPAVYLRSANRLEYWPWLRYGDLGFRCARASRRSLRLLSP